MAVSMMFIKTNIDYFSMKAALQLRYINTLAAVTEDYFHVLMM